MHLVGFIVRIYATMHGNLNVKFVITNMQLGQSDDIIRDNNMVGKKSVQ